MEKKIRSLRASGLPLLFALSLALGACNQSEQGRNTDIEPGVYKGKKDTQLTDAQRKALRDRLQAQGRVISGGGEY